MEELILYGIGGHAKVVADCLRSRAQRVVGLFDDNPATAEFLGLRVAPYSAEDYRGHPLLVCVGDNRLRRRICNRVGHAFGQCVHATATVSDSATLSEGCMIIHHAVVQAAAYLGRHCIVNTGAIVDHDCELEDYVHVAPGATLCGRVYVSEGTLVGANATVAPGVRIGRWCQIGAGAVVTDDVPDFATVVGVLGRTIRKS